MANVPLKLFIYIYKSDFVILSVKQTETTKNVGISRCIT